MSIFSHLDWTRLDVWAIVASAGLATIDEGRIDECRRRLEQENYDVVSVDFSVGLKAIIPQLGRIFEWEKQFGYTLKANSRNLDALRDGFVFSPSARTGTVLECVRPDLAWQEDPKWLLGFLSIAQEHCLHELALGNRFFSVLIVHEMNCGLIGQAIDQVVVPNVYSGRFSRPETPR